MGLDNSYNKFYVQEVWLDFFFHVKHFDLREFSTSFFHLIKRLIEITIRLK